MLVAPIVENELDRLLALDSYEIMDTPEESEYDDFVHLASQICQTPISLISLVDDKRQWFKASVGVDAKETNRDIAFCPHVIFKNDLMIVENALEDERFSDNPLVTGYPNIRFYAGAPLINSDGLTLGTLCVIDEKPRGLSQEQAQALNILAKKVVAQLELRRKNSLLNILNKELFDTNKQLTNANSIKNKLFAVISHDIRSPLASISNFITLLGNFDISKDEHSQIVDSLNKTIETTLGLLDNILTWAAPQIKGEKVESVTFNIKHKVDSVADRFLPTLLAKNITFINSTDTDVYFRFDKNGFDFILRNLLSNAVKYTSDGTIKVTALEKEQGLEMIIEDTGLGMSDEVKKSLETEGRAITTLGTNQEKGSGFGLYLIFDYIQYCNGNFFIDSEIGKGTKVTVYLPSAE